MITSGHEPGITFHCKECTGKERTALRPCKGMAPVCPFCGRGTWVRTPTAGRLACPACGALALVGGTHTQPMWPHTEDIGNKGP